MVDLLPTRAWERVQARLASHRPTKRRLWTRSARRQRRSKTTRVKISRRPTWSLLSLYKLRQRLLVTLKINLSAFKAKAPALSNLPQGKLPRQRARLVQVPNSLNSHLQMSLQPPRTQTDSSSASQQSDETHMSLWITSMMQMSLRRKTWYKWLSHRNL